MTLDARVQAYGHVRHAGHVPKRDWLALWLLGSDPQSARARARKAWQVTTTDRPAAGERLQLGQVSSDRPRTGPVHITGGLAKGRHASSCKCEACMAGRADFAESAGNVPLLLLRKRVIALSIALSVNPARADSALKGFHRAHEHFVSLANEMAVGNAFEGERMSATAQCLYQAQTFKQCGDILWARMVQNVNQRVKAPVVRARGTIGRTGVTEDDLFQCHECNRMAREAAQREAEQLDTANVIA